MGCVSCGLVRAVAAYGLPGTLAELPSAPLDGATWDALLYNAREQRVTGLLAWAIMDAAFAATEAQAAAASAAHTEAMASALTLEWALIDAITTLGKAGIETRVLKGPAAAHLDYPDPALRGFGDIDVLIRSADFRRAVELLTKAGYRRRYPEPRRGFDERFGKGASLRGPSGLEIDLHRTLALGPFGLRIPVAELWEAGSAVALGDLTVVALPAELRLLHACYHAALGHRVPRLVPLRDIAQLLLFGGIDQEWVLAAAGRWGGQAVVAHAVGRAWAGLQISDVLALSAWAEQYLPTSAEKRDLSCYHDADASYATKAAAALRALPKIRDKLAYGAALAIPRREYRRGAPVLPRLRRGLLLIAALGSGRR